MRNLFGLFACILLLAGAARADTPALRAFDSVSVVMDDLSSNIVEDGGNTDAIVNAVDKQLAAGNVVVFPDGGRVPLVLEISVDSLKAPGGKVYAYDVKVSAQTTVAVVIPPYTQTSAPIWTVSDIELSNTTDIQTSLKNTVLDCTALFIKEYMAQHPQPQR